MVLTLPLSQFNCIIMLSQTQSQKLQLKILPNQIQLLNIYHLTTLELEDRIKDELTDNPLLEESTQDESDALGKQAKNEVQDYMSSDEYVYDDIPDFRTEYQNYISQDISNYIPMANSMDFRQELKKQYRIQFDNSDQYAIADYLIDSLSNEGMLELDLVSLAEDYSFSTHNWVEKEDLEVVLARIQKLDPPGVGARDLRECLILKLKRLNQKRPDVKKAMELITDHFDDLRTGNLQKIKKHLHLEDEEVRIILKLLASLHSKPIVESSESMNAKKTIIPDFIVTGEKGDYHVSLYRQRSSDLFINKSSIYAARESAEANKKDLQKYLRNKLSSAQWFIYAIRERERNMLRIMREIVKFQEDYFEEGDIRKLKPMVLKNIAEKVNLDISAVSRITCNKYAETDFGIICLKDLFTEGITNQDGLSVSNKVIKSIIQEIIEGENKQEPYTDQQLTKLLAERGCSVARRTVAKYREQLQIPGAHRRGVWASIL